MAIQQYTLSEWVCCAPSDRMFDYSSRDWIVVEEAISYDKLPLLYSAPSTVSLSSQEDFGALNGPGLQSSVGAERFSHSQVDWERIKPILHQLYIGDNLLLRDAMQRLKPDRQFEAT